MFLKLFRSNSMCHSAELLFQIEAHASVAQHMLYELEDVKTSSSTESTLVLIDIAGYAIYDFN